MEAACREELRRAGLPGQGTLARLLVLLRGAPEPHLRLGDVVRMAAETKLAATAGELAGLIETLAAHGLLGRVPSAAAEPVFDTVAEPHSHLVYEKTGQIIDLHVSRETLLAMIRHALAQESDTVEILMRIRNGTQPASAATAKAEPIRPRGRTPARHC